MFSVLMYMYICSFLLAGNYSCNTASRLLPYFLPMYQISFIYPIFVITLCSLFFIWHSPNPLVELFSVEVMLADQYTEHLPVFSLYLYICDTGVT